MAAMDTLIPGIRTGSFAPCRAGGFAGNHLIHSSFIPAKSVSSRRMTVTLTTRSREVPAALRMSDIFSKHLSGLLLDRIPYNLPGYWIVRSRARDEHKTGCPYRLAVCRRRRGGVRHSNLDILIMSLAINFSSSNWKTRMRYPTLR
jgi:hypothetical protein